MTITDLPVRTFVPRTGRIAGTAALAAITLLATIAPARAADGAGVRVPMDAWAMTQTADGRLHVVTGRVAGELAIDATQVEAGSQLLSVQHDETVYALEVAAGDIDPMRAQQWALDKTSFESAWSVTRGKGVKVAVIDSGVAVNHEDLRGSVLPGKDYVRPGHDGRVDPNGHGTHVAGVIAAHANNNLGIDGAAPGVHILPVRVLDANGGGSASNVAKGIIWAADHGARVINLSLGGGKSPGLRQAIQYANTKRAVVIAAGGNNGQAGNAPMYPAAYPEAIAVASVNGNLAHSTFGNTGAYLDISAPGEGIVSSWGTSSSAYAAATGTSMATPYASAEAALIISAVPKLSALRVKQIMQTTAIHLGPNSVFGHGLVNPNGAVRAARARQPKPDPQRRLRDRILINRWLRALRG